MALQIDTPVQYLKGVGPKLGEILRKRGAGTLGQLLNWYPRTYEDRRKALSISSLAPEQLVSLKASVVAVRSVNLGKSRRRMYEVVVKDQTGRLSCKYFRVPYRGYFERFEPNQQVRISGKVIEYRGRIELHHPDIHPVGSEEEVDDSLLPVYTETEGLSPFKLRKIISTALVETKNWQDVDPLPEWLKRKYSLMSRSQALEEIHQPPKDQGDLFLNFKAPAQQRLIFDEFFWLELHLAKRKLGWIREAAPPMQGSGELVETLEGALEFQLTGAQKRALKEVLMDLAKPHPMHRLVQGDVGSGKTLVALLAACFAKESGYQSAIMVPTEILAEQHYKNASARLEPLGLRVALLTGHTKPAQRRQILEQLAAGEIDLCIGTHALIQDDVQFDSLGLVIIDEQHRFGVEQRQKLKCKGLSPHFLVMTATPIPRTLAMTVYGDLDVSIIDELPAGRIPIVTRKTYSSKREAVMGFVAEQIRQGRQAYVVYPLVEESEKMDLKDAVGEFERIQAEFPQFRVGLLHGRMKAQEKDQVMREFRAGELHILVSTTVIEVGVDVPNANIMVIEHAERFGLSQLHQLRGRVGRGPYKSYCVLMLGHAVSEVAKKRSEIMESSSDGFRIAEADLELRGPGEFLGQRQSGLPGFKLANLVRDMSLLQQARKAAFEVIDRDPSLELPEHQLLREQLDQQLKNYLG